MDMPPLGAPPYTTRPGGKLNDAGLTAPQRGNVRDDTGAPNYPHRQPTISCGSSPDPSRGYGSRVTTCYGGVIDKNTPSSHRSTYGGPYP